MSSAGISDSELAARVQSLMQFADMTKVTKKSVRHLLEEQFKVGLKDRKVVISDAVDQFVMDQYTDSPSVASKDSQKPKPHKAPKAKAKPPKAKSKKKKRKRAAASSGDEEADADSDEVKKPQRRAAAPKKRKTAVVKREKKLTAAEQRYVCVCVCVCVCGQDCCGISIVSGSVRVCMCAISFYKSCNIFPPTHTLTGSKTTCAWRSPCRRRWGAHGGGPQ
jgi:hypothetical protein